MFRFVGRRGREARIRAFLTENGNSYPKEVAAGTGLPYSTIHGDMRRMARQGKGIHVIPGFARSVELRD